MRTSLVVLGLLALVALVAPVVADISAAEDAQIEMLTKEIAEDARKVVELEQRRPNIQDGAEEITQSASEPSPVPEEILSSPAADIAVQLEGMPEGDFTVVSGAQAAELIETGAATAVDQSEPAAIAAVEDAADTPAEAEVAVVLQTGETVVVSEKEAETLEIVADAEPVAEEKQEEAKQEAAEQDAAAIADAPVDATEPTAIVVEEQVVVVPESVAEAAAAKDPEIQILPASNPQAEAAIEEAAAAPAEAEVAVELVESGETIVVTKQEAAALDAVGAAEPIAESKQEAAIEEVNQAVEQAAAVEEIQTEAAAQEEAQAVSEGPVSASGDATTTDDSAAANPEQIVAVDVGGEVIGVTQVEASAIEESGAGKIVSPDSPVAAEAITQAQLATEETAVELDNGVIVVVPEPVAQSMQLADVAEPIAPAQQEEAKAEVAEQLEEAIAAAADATPAAATESSDIKVTANVQVEVDGRTETVVLHNANTPLLKLAKAVNMAKAKAAKTQTLKQKDEEEDNESEFLAPADAEEVAPPKNKVL